MAAQNHTILSFPGFPQLLDSLIGREIEFVDGVLDRAYECTDRDCPCVGLHNTDECADLIAQAREEGQL